MTKEKGKPIGLGLQTTSCGVGILVTEIDKNSAAMDSDLRIGDCVLSIDLMVPSSPKDAVGKILAEGDTVKFVVIGEYPPTTPRGSPPVALS